MGDETQALAGEPFRVARLFIAPGDIRLISPRAFRQPIEVVPTLRGQMLSEIKSCCCVALVAGRPTPVILAHASGSINSLKQGTFCPFFLYSQVGKYWITVL